MTPFGFSRRNRLQKTDDFSSVFSFRKRIFGNHLVLHFVPTSVGYARVGIVVSRKIARCAVHRNYMKRVVRELFRQNHGQLESLDLIVSSRKKFDQTSRSAVCREWAEMVAKLRTQGNRSVS